MLILIGAVVLLSTGVLLSILSKLIPLHDSDEWEKSAKEFLGINNHGIIESSYFTPQSLQGEFMRSPVKHVIKAAIFCLICVPAAMAPSSIIDDVLICGVLACLFISALIDLDNKYIPDLFVVLGLFSAYFHLIHSGQDLTEAVLGSMVGYGIISITRVLFLITRKVEAIGLGDAKLLALAGAFVGVSSISYVLLLATTISILVVAIRKGESKQIPFGPGIAAGTIVLYYYPSYSSILGLLI